MNTNSMMNNGNYKFIEPLAIPDARIVVRTRNFSGNNPGKFDRPDQRGRMPRHFSILLDPEKFDIPKLQEIGWNIKIGKPNPEDPDYVPGFYLRVHADWYDADEPRFKFNPIVFKVNSEGQTQLDAETIKELDTAEIEMANMTITGRWMESPSYTGVVAYLKKMAVKVSEDEDMSDLFEGLI